MNELPGFFCLFVPLLVGGVVHGVVMKRDAWRWLKRPLDGDRRLGGAPDLRRQQDLPRAGSP